MTLSDLAAVLDSLAPIRHAESWDNVGLLVGDPKTEARKAMVTIDYTPAVATETYAAGCDVVIAYHPPIFHAFKRLQAPSLVFEAIRRGIAIYSPHTALDVATGGTNDVLAEILGIGSPQPLRSPALNPWHYKLITFVPQNAAQRVCDALFEAGAGWIGNYSHCTFRSEGTGTFLPHEGTSPAIGEVGKLEYVPEIRVETIVPAKSLGDVVNALRASHPYEEPAFDIVQLTTPPDGRGMGRIGSITPTPRSQLIQRIREGLGVPHLLVSGPTDGEVTRAACLAGDGGSFVDDAIARRADLLLTGEVKHHDALKAANAGLTVVCALHSNSERITMSRYAQRIRELSKLEVLVSSADRDPFTIL